MDLLKQKIMEEGKACDDKVLKVDSFLNHQLDIDLLNNIGKEFKSRFANKGINKILTVEASGIAIAFAAAQYFNVPVVFAKKSEASNLDKDAYEADVFSFTKNKSYKIRAAKKFLGSDDRVLIIDDFLANGKAALGLISLVKQSAATLEGIGIVIEKEFQGGRKAIEELGVKVESLAIIERMDKDLIIFK